MSAPPARFLFLQGPHGPFFALLARRLSELGHDTLRVGFNAGDGLFRRGFRRYWRYGGDGAGWSDWLAEQIASEGVTDIVLYGTTRPVHADALALAAARGLRSHVFEEGYLRPWWVTYERGGTNAASRLMEIDVAEMAEALGALGEPPPAAPARWGDTRQHVFWGAVTHAATLAGSLVRPPIPTHREPGLPAELAIALRYLALMPFTALARRQATARLKRAAAPYHLVLLQLAHDETYRRASPYPSNEAFVEDVIGAFGTGAPSHHHLVFKAHPLEDGRQPLARTIRRIARRRGLGARVHFMAGARLGPLLDNANSALTVNSTAAHQALWRGLPVKVLGPAPHAKPEFTSDQSLVGFYRAPALPDRAAYLTFRRYLLATCQVPGGFYAAAARRRLLRYVVDRVLSPHDPYDMLRLGDASAQQLVLLPGGKR
ncbi:MAG: capsule biosynthesis protein CapA [Paracoccaceae bacterium]|nr:capsule biosynthesis protein CapA [Paracoccaceae bacterium]